MSSPISPLETARRGRGLTQAELAARAGISTATVGRIERGEFRPSSRTALALAAVLGVSVDVLLAPPSTSTPLEAAGVPGDTDPDLLAEVLAGDELDLSGVA